MKECEKYTEMMSAMLDGELGLAESEQLIAHMSSCAQCRELYEMLSAVTGSEVWELPDVPEGLHEHIMSGVKSAASVKKKEGLMRKIRPWAMAAACLVIIAGVIFGVPRFFRTGNSSSPSGAFNTSAAANNSAPAADNAAPAEAPADNAGYVTSFTPESSSQESSEEGKSADDGANSIRGDENAYGSAEAAPVPEPEDEPEDTEPPTLNIDIDRSVVTVEANGKSVSEKLNRDDTLIWLRAVIVGQAGGNIDAAKIEIFRLEGADYEVYIYYDGAKLMGSLTEDLANSIELNELSDFALFEQMADGVK